MKNTKKCTDFTVISISVDSQKRLKELAKKERYTIRAMLDILMDKYEKENK